MRNTFVLCFFHQRAIPLGKCAVCGSEESRVTRHHKMAAGIFRISSRHPNSWSGAAPWLWMLTSPYNPHFPHSISPQPEQSMVVVPPALALLLNRWFHRHLFNILLAPSCLGSSCLVFLTGDPATILLVLFTHEVAAVFAKRKKEMIEGTERTMNTIEPLLQRQHAAPQTCDVASRSMAEMWPLDSRQCGTAQFIGRCGLQTAMHRPYVIASGCARRAAKSAGV